MRFLYRFRAHRRPLTSCWLFGTREAAVDFRKRSQVTSCCFKAICAFRAKFFSAALAFYSAVAFVEQLSRLLEVRKANRQERELGSDWQLKVSQQI